MTSHFEHSPGDADRDSKCECYWSSGLKSVIQDMLLTVFKHSFCKFAELFWPTAFLGKNGTMVFKLSGSL